MSEPRFESPLAGQVGPHGLAVSIAEIVDRGMIDLRGDLGNRSFAKAVETVLGVALPHLPRTSTSAGELSVLWLSVDQWLVQGPRSQASGLVGKLQKALVGIPSLAVDMSDARTIIRLQGDGAREVIMKGAPVDLTAPEFKTGAVRRLRFGELAAMVHLVGESPDVVDLYVFRSYAVFAWEWLVATGKGTATIRLFAPQVPPGA